MPKTLSSFLLVLIASCMMSAQTLEIESNRSKEAIKVESFGRAPNGYIRAILDSFLADLQTREKGTRGFFIVYGPVRDVDARKRLLSNHILFRNFDKTLISYVQGGNVSEFRTDLWIVAKGAEGPKLPPEAFIISETGKATQAQLKAAAKKVFRTISDNPDHHIYIISYGTDAQLTRRERVIAKEINLREQIRPRITIVRGGRKTAPRTVFWSIPPGAANPVP